LRTTPHSPHWFNQETSGPRQKLGINPPPQSFGLLSCRNRGALDSDTACQQDSITDGDAGLSHKASWSDLAEHLTDQNRAVQAWSDFRVSAAERDAEFVARGPHISHDGLGQFGCRAILRKERDDEEPQRTCAQDGNVVRIDVNRVTSDLIRGKGDWIGRDDEIAISSINDGSIFANLRSDQQARIVLWQMLKQRSQMLRRKFADWQNPVSLAALHALTPGRAQTLRARKFQQYLVPINHAPDA
jgi:hypothetical protein